jgi:hypothetical protein
MNCEKVETLIIDYLDNTLDEGSRKEIEKHLETCERCLDEIRESQQVIHLISKNVDSTPDESMRINFYHMLHNEIKKNDLKSIPTSNRSSIPWYGRSSLRIAAGLALLISGTFIGILINTGIKNSKTADELKQLQSEVTLLKRTAMFTMLKEESSSDRIQAVSYADALDTPDENVIDVLVKTLNHDKNVNVRMAAAYALSKFAGQRSVCDSLVNSLSLQTDPILQVTLINILAERKEKSALKPIQQIISSKSTLKEVRAVAENSLRVLL